MTGMTTPKPKRRWFQYSLRTLLVVVTLCAMLCSWLGLEMKKKTREREAVAAIKKLGGYVWYDYQHDGTDNPDWKKGPPPGPACLRKVLGNDFFATVVGMCLIRSEVTDADLDHIRRLPHLKMLQIGDTNTTDAGIENLKGLTQLERLGIGGTKITDAGIEALQKALPKSEISRVRPYHPGSCDLYAL